ncbi:two pore domain potassium channel family protein [Streptomyces sp. TRM66268-LWL]|uniref:Two pore domain potassium channel family protein n=1 Tax=Streptomyces polyasparticus TaxID=2767826 RepID=A0ABR7SJJ5_9ACTN|nr:potassium channel family protein [Streptomyces polyasparticus]MBC9715608.1 two pore domain potassium channel family protein [Streptomyces polyasparticus]
MDHDSPQERWRRRTEIPLAVGSMLFLGAYAAQVLVHDMPQVWRHVCFAVVLGAWALFAVDYGVRWRMSGRGLKYIRTHWLETLVLLLPLLRPLRVVRLYEAIQMRHGEPRLSLYARVMVYAGLSVLLLGFAGALAVYHHERLAPGANITTFGDAVWWTCSTLSTVGYGDKAPVTPVGRLVAVALMACGLGLLGAVTGSFSSWLIQVFTLEDAKRRARNRR